MLLQIGTTRRTAPEDAADLLLECHARIRAHLALAVRLGRPGGAAPEAVRDAASQVRRYFAEALPLHIADEDELITPRLAGASAALDRDLAEMHREHLDHEAAVARLIACCAALEADAAARTDLLPIALGLEARLLAHLELEERSILPALRALPAAERRALAQAMRARRAERA